MLVPLKFIWDVVKKKLLHYSLIFLFTIEYFFPCFVHIVSLVLIHFVTVVAVSEINLFDCLNEPISFRSSIVFIKHIEIYFLQQRMLNPNNTVGQDYPF